LGDEYVETLRRIIRAEFRAARIWSATGSRRRGRRSKPGRRNGPDWSRPIRFGAGNRKVLERIRESSTIFTPWSDEPWINEGAAVRVSLVCFSTALPSPACGRGVGGEGAMLNGQPVAAIHADLTVPAMTTRPLACCHHGFTSLGHWQKVERWKIVHATTRP
jgi:hypothetical protein